MHKNEAYTRTLKKLSANFGIEISGVYGVLVDIHEYLKAHDQLTGDGYFYVTVPTLSRLTKLKRRKQENIVKLMEEIGLIHTMAKGFPSKRYIKLLPFDVSSLPYSFTEEVMSEEYGIDENTGSTKRTNNTYETYQQYVQNVPTIGTKRTNYTYETYHNREHNNKEQIYRNHNNKERTEQSETIKLYQSAFGVVNSILYSDIKEDIETYGEDWTCEALKRAIGNNARSWNYTKKILQNWSERYPRDSKPWEEERLNGKSKNKPRKTQRDDVDWANEPNELVL